MFRRTHTAEVDRDQVTGNKVINQYEILEELGRGEHGKVKLGRHVTTRQQVAVKIVQRYSKRRRLGKLGNPEDKVKKEVAILKKARHPNVVSLLEVIDDPNRQKVYIVLEYVEHGEIVWRRKGLREIVHVDRLRFERERAGVGDTPAFLEESRQYLQTAQHIRSQREKARQRRQAQAAYARQHAVPAWSLEHGGDESEEDDLSPELSIARTSSRSLMNYGDAQYSPSYSFHHDAALTAMEGSMYGAYTDYPLDKRFSTGSSSLGYTHSEPEWFMEDDDMSYVPCLTLNQARNAFRDSVLGIEYLHYQGIIHRDIKPANLLVTSGHRIKISDFGVSYLGRPIRDEEEEQVTETDASELDDARELSKTVGTPAFYAPELCYTGDDFVNSIGTVPRITGAIDVWSLGVTLYGMVFGRLPFVSDDEYSMFQTIVKRDVFIPRKRLKPVEDDPSTVSQWPRTLNSNKRADDELMYEDISDELYDLLKRILTKDPVKRITLKEIKHHPWVLHGLPNPRTWVEETDPSYQSKGKRIEVSNEEVTTAVSKVPFIERVRSNVAKWSHYLTGRSKDKDGRKRTPSLAPSFESSSTSSSNTFGKYASDGRRGSLKEDEDPARPSRLNKDGEHPLSQSVTASPVGRDEQTSYFAPGPRSESSASHDRARRPDMPERGVSTLSSAGSTKTVRPSGSDAAAPSHLRSGAPALVGSLGSSSLGGFFGGASRRLARGLQTGDWRREKPASAEASSGDGNGRSEPSLAVSVTSAVGQVQNSDLLRDKDSQPPHAESSTGECHRHDRPQQVERKHSAEPLHLTKEALLRQRRAGNETAANGGYDTTSSRPETQQVANDPLNLRQVITAREIPPGNRQTELPTGGLITSPPSAATMSSLSVDDSTTAISPSASHPSIPSVVSGASSLSGDDTSGHLTDKESETPVPVPPIFRTGETVKARRPSSPRNLADTQPVHYCYDEESSSEDEGIVIGKKKPAPRG